MTTGGKAKKGEGGMLSEIATGLNYGDELNVRTEDTFYCRGSIFAPNGL